jgi:hypothetical protein
MRELLKLLTISGIMAIALADIALGQTQKLQISPAITRNCVPVTGSSTQGWTWGCTVYAYVLNRQTSVLYLCTGGVQVRWDPAKIVIKNQLSVSCSSSGPAFQTASGEYDAAVQPAQAPVSTNANLAWFVASQQDKKIAFCFSGNTGAGAPVPNLDINKCGSTDVP